MRGHSAICSVGLGTPFIGLATHDKIAGFLDELGLGEFGFDLDENPRLDGLDQAILEILATPEPVRQRLVDLRRDLRARTREFHREIAALLGVPWST